MARINPSLAKAAGIARRVFSQLKIAPGMTEKEVAGRIKQLLKKYKSRPSFRIIVASGKRSALPHGFASGKKIKKGELVVIDFGAVYNGYRSDITRTLAAGRFSKRQREIYSIVKKAKQKAVAELKAGRSCREVDRAARRYIESKGCGKYFIHSTGHGVGKRVHEAPKISAKNSNLLKAGMVVAIEPGIYIKNFGGVRLEDMYAVTKSGCRMLTG